MEDIIKNVLAISGFCWMIYKLYVVLAGNMGWRIVIGLGSVSLGIGLVIYCKVPIVEKGLTHVTKTEILLFFSVLVLLQQEVRQVLARLGNYWIEHGHKLLEWLGWQKAKGNAGDATTAIVEAAKTLKGSNTGALIVFARSTDMGRYEQLGDALDALVSKRLLLAIFNKMSPLHDGGVIIRQGRVTAARCIFPVTEQQDLPAYYGLRHRAAIGLTEQTDALVLVISEETGQFAIARNGHMNYGLATQEARTMIKKYLQSSKRAGTKGPDVKSVK